MVACTAGWPRVRPRRACCAENGGWTAGWCWRSSAVPARRGSSAQVGFADVFHACELRGAHEIGIAGVESVIVAENLTLRRKRTSVRSQRRLVSSAG
jgi:hypothetical protein